MISQLIDEPIHSKKKPKTYIYIYHQVIETANNFQLQSLSCTRKSARGHKMEIRLHAVRRVTCNHCVTM